MYPMGTDMLLSFSIISMCFKINLHFYLSFALWIFRTLFTYQIQEWRVLKIDLFVMDVKPLFVVREPDYMTQILGNLLRLVLWLRTWSTLVNVVNSGHIVLYKSKRPSLLILVSKFSIALLIFCQLVLLIIERGVLKFSAVMMDISVSP